MKQMLVWVMSMLLALTCVNISPSAAIASGTNLVVNGSFEKPVVNFVGLEKSIQGWQLSQGNLIEIDNQYISKPFEGSQSVELDSYSVSRIYQDIPTEVGNTYKLTFAFKGSPKVSDNRLNVRWGDTVVANLNKTASDTEWEVYTYDLKATSTSTRLSFDNLNEASDGFGTFIDGVSVEAKMPVESQSVEAKIPMESQYATSIIDFSSQWNTSTWSAQQALGKPDNSIWSPSLTRGNSEFITLGYDNPVFASGVKVHEGSRTGSITRVDVIDMDDISHTVWEGIDPVDSTTRYSEISWNPTSFLVKGVRIYIENKPNECEYIESVELYGVSVEVKIPVESQYATSIIDFSSQYSSGNWSAEQVLGEPNTFSYGDINTSWTTSSANGGIEFITVGYDQPVFATGVTVRETLGNGFVTQVDVVDESDIFHTVWQGVDSSQAGNPVDFYISWKPTTYSVKGVKIYVDTQHSSSWEEIDSVKLHSVE